MPKRKRDDDVLGLPQPRIESLLARGVNNVVRAMTVAKGFERQKMGRRLKTATEAKDGKAIDRIKREIEVMKDMDLASHASTHICKRLLRIKAVAASSELPDSARNAQPAAGNLEVANVLARLLKAPLVAAEMKKAIDSVEKAISTDSGRNEAIETPGYPQATKRDHVRNEAGWEGTEGEMEEFYLSDSNNLAVYDGLVASGSEDDSGSDEGAEDLDHNPPELRQDSQDKDHPKRLSISLSPSPSSEVTQRQMLKSIPASSSFIPSLSNVGYISGSESDASDIEEHVAPRKNRRGQRARQAIWEKKFGETARHLGKPKKEKRDEGWDARRGAVSKDDDKRRKGSRRTAQATTQEPGFDSTRTSKFGDEQSKAKRDDQGKLHPSWEAAKRSKEQKKTSAFQGQKITFD